jgi:hypothetical protein
MIEVELPDGRVVEIETTDPNVAAQAAQKFMASAQQPAPQAGMLEDAAKSVGSGLASATAGVLGAGGDLRSLLSAGTSAIGGKLGVEPDKVQAFKDMVSKAAGMTATGAVLNNAPTSRDIVNSATDPVVSPDYKPQTLTGSYLKTGAEFLPGALVGQGGWASRILQGVALPAVASETAGQLTKGTSAEPYARAGAALLSPAIVSAGRRAVTPLPASAERQALTQTLQNEGVPLTAGQTSGSKPLQWMESALGDAPGAGSRSARMMENQGEAFTAAALRRAGVNANRATPEVMDDAFRRIGGDFEGVARRNNLLPDARLNNDLGRAEREYNNLVSQSNRAPVVTNTIEDLRGMIAGGQISGAQYNALTSQLATQARGAAADPRLQSALQGIRSAIDNAMERTLLRTNNQQDMQVLRNARREYRNLLVLEKAATGAGSNAAEGLISPSQLRNSVVQQSRRAYGRGQGDFADLARAGEALLKPLPNSGTSPRANAMNILQTIGAIAGGGAGAAGGPGGAALGALAGLAAPAVAGRTLLSGPVQRYLGNQRLAPTQDNSAPTRALTNLLLSGGLLRLQGQ